MRSGNILRLGNYIERADMTTRIIDMRTADLFAGQHDLEPFQHIQWRSVLRSFSALQAYQTATRGSVEPAAVLHFLFKHRRLPRSYRRCLNGAARALRDLPRSARPAAACAEATRALDDTDVRALGAAERQGDLHRFIDQCQSRLAELHETISRTYFE